MLIALFYLPPPTLPAALATVRKSVIVPHPCESMFALVDDVERYPEFLPWCTGVELLERTPELTRARLDIDYRGLRSHIATLNRKEPPYRMALEFIEGPFERFGGEWRFVPLGDAGCRVELGVDYEFSSRSLELALGSLFGHVTGTLVDRFVDRAEALAP